MQQGYSLDNVQEKKILSSAAKPGAVKLGGEFRVD